MKTGRGKPYVYCTGKKGYTIINYKVYFISSIKSHHLDKNNNLKGLSKLQGTSLTNNMQKLNH